MKILLLIPMMVLSVNSAASIYKYDPQLIPMLRPDGRIVGGRATTIDDFPFQVSYNNYGAHRGGGVILSPTKVLTAGHVIRGTMLRLVTIRAGSTYHHEGGVQIAVRRMIEHDMLHIPTAFNNDIALIFLVSPLEFGPGIQPIQLPLQDDDLDSGVNVTISGWGTLSSGGVSPLNLQYVEIPVVDRDICANAYRNVNAVNENMICAGLYGVGGRDACQGDSGGGVVIGNIVHGLVSWGTGCALPNFPGVNTRVAYYRDWIDSIDENSII